MDARDPIESLHDALARWLDGALVVAFSGGIDSSALLHALAHLPAARARGLRAIHVDHGIAADSAAWSRHCAALCATLGVPFDGVRVDVPRADGSGLEAAARTARYGAIAATLRAGEIVVTAHHADDQAETLLLRLMRGAAPGGLAAMRPWRDFGVGFLARPWLGVTRAAIAAYAQTHALVTIHDPSNDDVAHLRNYLRHRVLAPLALRVPQATQALGRSAQLLAAADDELAQLADRAIADAADVSGRTVAIDVMRALSPFVRGFALRRWCASLGLAPPDAPALREIDLTLLDVRGDAQAQVRWRGGVLRAWRGRWHAATRGDPPAPFASTDWHAAQPLVLPDGWGELRIDGPTSDDAPTLRVQPRTGGERIAVHPRRPRQSVRTSLQALGVPPWQRAAAPYAWQGDTLVAVGDWLVDHAFAATLAARSTRLVWTPPPD